MQKISFQQPFLVAAADLDWEQAEAQRGDPGYRYLLTAGGETAEVVGPALDWSSAGMSRAEYRSLRETPRAVCCFFVKEGGEFQIVWGLGPLTCRCNAQVRGSVQVTLLRPVRKDFPRRLMKLVPAEYVESMGGAQYLFWEKSAEGKTYGLGAYLKQRLIGFLKAAAGVLADRGIGSALEYEAALREVLCEDAEYLRFAEECRGCGLILGGPQIVYYSPLPGASGLAEGDLIRKS